MNSKMMQEKITCAVGDEIEVVVDRKTEEDLILSRDKAVRTRVWDDIVEAHEAGTLVSRNDYQKS